MSGFADAFDGKPTVGAEKPPRSQPESAASACDAAKRCLFCGLDLYIPNLSKHPCCVFAEAAGYTECAGCMAFEGREKKPKKRGR